MTLNAIRALVLLSGLGIAVSCGIQDDILRKSCTADSQCGEGQGCRAVEGAELACVKVDSTGDGGVIIDPNAPTYLKDTKAILDRNCIVCHDPPANSSGSGRTDFSLARYEDKDGVLGVHSMRQRIIDRAVNAAGTASQMPPGGPIPQAQRDTLKAWLVGGAALGTAVVATDAGTPDSGSPGQVSFARDITKIFSDSCVSCHTGTGSGGLDLTAAVAYANLVGIASQCRASVKRVVAGDPSKSLLWLKTSDDAAKCGSAMPLGSTGLKTTQPADFAKLEKWIQDGALNN